MAPVDPADHVDRLLAARDTGGAVPAEPGLDLTAGYRVGAALAGRLADRGWTRAGRKIGFTNAATWSAMGLESPMWAPVWHETLHVGVDVFSLAGTREVRLEPEVAVGLASDLPDTVRTAADAGPHVAWAAIAIELVDNHHDHWPPTPGEAVADFGLHAALLLGPRLPDASAAALRELEVVLRRDDGPDTGADAGDARRGAGRDVLGGPLDALARLPGLPGAAPVRAGEVVTTGTLLPPPLVAAGQRWSVLVDGVVRMSLRLE